MPSLSQPISDFKRQHGGALLVMLVILVMGITTVFISSLSGTALKNKRNQSTSVALAQAKEALIAYAVTYGDTHTSPSKPHGYLPCPDKGTLTEGSAPSACTGNQLGRLPWRTLDLPTLFDGAGECLWYAVSGNYSNKSLGIPMNWDTAAQLHVYGSDGVEILPGEIVAVVIAPGAALSSNSDRSGSSAPTCGGNYTASAYLENDTVHGKNNADITQASFILPHEDSSTVRSNDQFVFITRQDIWNIVQKRIARQAKKCLDDYAEDASNTNHKYPWAAQIADTTAHPNRSGFQNVRFGRFPDVVNISTSGSTGSCPSSSSALSGLTAAQIASLNNYIQQVQDALNAYLAGTGTKSSLKQKGDNLKDIAKNAPYNLPWSDPIRSAGSYVDNNCDSSEPCDTTIIQNMLDAAFTEITDCTNSGSSTDNTMPSSWGAISSTTCTDLINSASWAEWRDLTFYEVADGFQPGSSGVCVSCLSITGSGNINGGSGNYHAAIALASRMIAGQTTRTATSVADYLEGTNQTGLNFLTYRLTDPNYSTVNDLVSCVDGKNNCK